MRVVIVYREDSENSRAVTEFMRDFEYRTGHQLSTINPDTAEGVSFCGAYEIMDYPTVIALSDDGVMQTVWQGMPLPTINEVSYYVQSN